MKSLLVLQNIKVENANAISGIIYGFPAISNFLGYVHALSRDLHAKLGLKLGGCGVICHKHQVHTHKIGHEFVFSLTRNPLSQDGKTSSFNEEGKVQMEASLIIECDFTSDDFNSESEFKNLIYELASKKRLAGGYITELKSVIFKEISEDEEGKLSESRQILRKLLPGFVLLDRSELLKNHMTNNPQLSALDALLDFCVLKSKAIDNSGKIKWETTPKPINGWIVPIQSGYKAISPIYEPGEVSNSRDPNVPFRFVEPIYGLAEWIGLHRVSEIENILWRYQNDHEIYICTNKLNNKIGE